MVSQEWRRRDNLISISKTKKKSCILHLCLVPQLHAQKAKAVLSALEIQLIKFWEPVYIDVLLFTVLEFLYTRHFTK